MGWVNSVRKGRVSAGGGQSSRGQGVPSIPRSSSRSTPPQAPDCQWQAEARRGACQVLIVKNSIKLKYKLTWPALTYLNLTWHVLSCQTWIKGKYPSGNPPDHISQVSPTNNTQRRAIWGCCRCMKYFKAWSHPCPWGGGRLGEPRRASHHAAGVKARRRRNISTLFTVSIDLFYILLTLRHTPNLSNNQEV